MDFGEVLTKAWKIVWKFKILWIFGIFAGCGTNRGFSFNGGGSGFQNGGVPGSTPNLPPGFEDNMLRLMNFFENPAVIAGFISLICIFIFIAVFFSIMGKVGLIKGAQDADAGAEHLGFGELWKSGLHYFWRFLGLSLIIGSPILLIYLALIFGAILVFFAFMSGSGNGSFGAAPALVVLIPVICIFTCVVFLLAIVISFLSPQAERAIVIENEGVISGIRRGWNVLTTNLGPILIVWLILVVISVVAGILFALPLLIIVVPLFITYVFAGSNASYTPLIVAGLCIAAYIPVALVANGILTAYLESVWTLSYLRLTMPKLDMQAPVTLPNNA